MNQGEIKSRDRGVGTPASNSGGRSSNLVPEKCYPDGKGIRVSITPNPSMLMQQ
jgi:hypothetical protein